MKISIQNQKRKVNNVFVGLDYDGTLTAPGYPIFPELIQKIIDLERLGISLFFASGKSMAFIQHFVDQLGISPRFICAENGGHVLDVRKGMETIFGAQTDLDSFIQAIEKEPLPAHIDEDKISIWTKRFGDNVEDAVSIIRKLITEKGFTLSVYTHPDGALDVVPDGIDKANLLDFIPRDATIHFVGDSHNDLGIMQNARVLPHTVANANREVKDLVARKGGYIAPTSVGHGVLGILRNILESIQSEMPIGVCRNNTPPLESLPLQRSLIVRRLHESSSKMELIV